MAETLIVKTEKLSVQMSPLASLCLIGCWPETHAELAAHLKTHLDLDLPDDGRVPGQFPGGYAYRIHRFKILLSSDNRSDIHSLLTRGFDAQTGSLSEQSHGRMRFAVTGAHAVEFLRRGVPLDPDHDLAAPGEFAQTLLGDANVLLHRTGAQEFQLFVPTSFCGAMSEWAQRTAKDIII